MSVLFGRNDAANGSKKARKMNSKPQHEAKRPDEELFVFGYSCKMFEDSGKADFLEQGKHLIQWPGDSSLLIDRYDGRLHFTDKSQFEARGEQGALTPQEAEIERMCDEERYLELNTDLLEEEIHQEEEMKRFKEALAIDGAYNAVGFGYGDTSNVPPQESNQPVQGPTPEVLETFVAPEELEVPSGMEIPDTSKSNAIIERTAVFVSTQGTQMEILVKAKQAGNPQFDFLNFENWLNPYYKHMLKYIKEGKYMPVIQSQPSPQQEEESEEEDSDEEYELHPLLTASQTNTNSPSHSAPLSPGLNLGDKFNRTFAPEGTAHSGAPYAVGGNQGPLYGEGPAGPMGFQEPWPKDQVQYQYEVPCSGYGSPPPPPGMMEPYASLSMPYMYPPMQAPPVMSVADMIPPPPPPPGEGPPEEEWLYECVHSPVPVTPIPPPPPPPILPPFLAPPDSPGMPNTLAAPPVMPAVITPMPKPTPAVSIIPPPPDLQPIVDKLAIYVAKNGPDFENIIKAKRDPRFDFVHPWNEHHAYYQFKIRLSAEEVENNKGTNKESASSSNKANTGSPISFSIKTKDTPKPKIEYRSNVIYKQSCEPGESEEEEENAEDEEQGEVENGSSGENNGDDSECSEQVMNAEEQNGNENNLEQEDAVAAAQREAQRLETESQIQVDKQLQLERRRKASLFISMLKKSSGPEDEAQGQGETADDGNTRRKFTERKREQEDSRADDTEAKRGRYEDDEIAASGVGAPSPDIIRATQDLMAKVRAASRNKR